MQDSGPTPEETLTVAWTSVSPADPLPYPGELLVARRAHALKGVVRAERAGSDWFRQSLLGRRTYHATRMSLNRAGPHARASEPPPRA